mmetsp:Transcript_27983/g.64585  ORF Transcript_27983/g.64585 Transcript_27983/m.64585 type:complete len:248 (+) Transcript_27983:898-1641(+)
MSFLRCSFLNWLVLLEVLQGQGVCHNRLSKAAFCKVPVSFFLLRSSQVHWRRPPSSCFHSHLHQRSSTGGAPPVPRLLVEGHGVSNAILFSLPLLTFFPLLLQCYLVELVCLCISIKLLPRVVVLRHGLLVSGDRVLVLHRHGLFMRLNFDLLTITAGLNGLPTWWRNTCACAVHSTCLAAFSSVLLLYLLFFPSQEILEVLAHLCGIVLYLLLYLNRHSCAWALRGSLQHCKGMLPNRPPSGAEVT